MKTKTLSLILLLSFFNPTHAWGKSHHGKQHISRNRPVQANDPDFTAMAKYNPQRVKPVNLHMKQMPLQGRMTPNNGIFDNANDIK